MAKRTTFDFESFTKLLRREFSTYISTHELEELENLWYMNKIDRAFSKTAIMYHRLPKRKITEGLRDGIQAFQDATMETTPRCTSGKRFDPERYIGSPTSPGKYFDPDRHIGSPTSLDRKKTNTDNDLVYYIRLLARGIRNKNFDYIEEVRNLDGMNEGIQDLRWMAYYVKELVKQIEDLKQNYDKYLWETGVDGLSQERDAWQVSFDNLRYQKTNLEETIRKYSTTVERLEREISTLKKKNLQIKHQTDARNLLLKRATVHGETMGIYDKKDYDKEMPETKESSVSLQKRVEELEAKCFDLGERNSSLINQVQAKNVQLKKVTKHVEATDTDNDELQDRLKEAEQRIKQIEQDKRELEEKCLILKERTSGSSGSASSQNGELATVRAENNDLRARLLFQESIRNQSEVQRKEHKRSKENDGSPNKIKELEQVGVQHAEHRTGDISCRDRLHVTKHKADEQDQTNFRIEQLEKENNSLKSRLQTAIGIINQPEKTDRRRRDLITDDIAVTNRLQEDGDELDLSTQTDSKIKELEFQNSSLRKRLQDALDRNKETEKSEIRLKEHGTDVSGFTDRLSGTRDQTIQLEKVQSKLEEVENEKRSLEERLQEALGKINHLETDDRKKKDAGTGYFGFMRNEQLQNQLEVQQQEVERLQTELRHRDENRTEQNMTDMHHQTGRAPLTERQIERFEQQKEKLLDRNRNLQKQIDQLKEDVSRLTKEHRQKDDYCTELSRKRDEWEAVPAMSQNDNPMVMNISDPLRPTAIARKYDQLYEGEWADGLDLLGQFGEADSESAQTLMNVVKECYLFCVQRAEIQRQKVTEALLLFESTNPDKEYHDDERNSPETQEALLPFTEKCVELCWYMVLQSPPVYIEDCDKYTKGSDFNKDVFQFYTSSGTKLDFVVWPPLYLYKDGPLLSKGVAQPLSI